ncbi:hypothetical protein [Ralstonia solanacearum]|uniref:hypothetical protein n=1 Tax=Ralstonia solanacearum TaxID=305 RepID=UPI0012D40925|nr:hypothetical protein [Ralstonia solanacearum]MDC6176651.1 hypothetical protein [Ralstonia solanacearum]MDC6210023.1 hypothetical protein [Ralstonia solanacearum]MDC6238157.1 hypothetical protein [Ralstonia solanacearum]MDD7800100.1 hypothetical protein [Ralstonia solanacearum]
MNAWIGNAGMLAGKTEAMSGFAAAMVSVMSIFRILLFLRPCIAMWIRFEKGPGLAKASVINHHR